MRTNIRGWKARQAAARLRQASMADRMRLNAIRSAHYRRLEKGEPPVQEIVDEAPEPTPEDEATEEEAKVINPEDLTNAELRAALEQKGFEVPKTTARTRLIELYTEHVK